MTRVITNHLHGNGFGDEDPGGVGVGDGGDYFPHCVKSVSDGYNSGTGINIFQAARWDEMILPWNNGARVFILSWEMSPHQPLVTGFSESSTGLVGNHWVCAEGLPWYTITPVPITGYPGYSGLPRDYRIPIQVYRRPLLPLAYRSTANNGGIGTAYIRNTSETTEGYWPGGYNDPYALNQFNWQNTGDPTYRAGPYADYINERHNGAWRWVGPSVGGQFQYYSRNQSTGLVVWMKPELFLYGSVDEAWAALSNCSYIQFYDNNIP